MKKLLLPIALLIGLLCPSTGAAANEGIPEITKSNILHCFSWPIKYIREELPNIAAAGFGAIQISPMQRSDIDEGWTWYTIYLPYDYHAYSSPGMGSREDLRSLCQEAEAYGIDIIVDVAINHVNKTEPYYNPWWKDERRYREWGGEGSNIDYNSRYSITHNRLGDYVELNTENADAIARAKAFMEELKELGVKGIRFDAAKHIELPSETRGNGQGVWPEVTSVDGLFYYGEIVGQCVNGNDDAIMEYAQYIWVPDNMYSTVAARDNGGVPTAPGGARDKMTDGHLIYWAESHDDYSNDEWSERVDQGIIDRAYCALACRNTQSALYYSRPRARGKDNIKIEKGSTAFMSKQVVEVNKFRKAMKGRKDYFTCYDNGAVACVTREGGGAVIVSKEGNFYVTVKNGGGYCPQGTYTDRVSGNTFTVESDGHIKGTVGPTGVAIIYNDNQVSQDYQAPATPNAVTITGSKLYNVAYAGNFSNGKNYIHYWNSNVKDSGTQWPGVPMERAMGDDGRYYWCYAVPPGMDHIIFNNGTGDDAMQTGNLPLVSDYIMDNGGATIIPVSFTTGNVTPEPGKKSKTVKIEGDFNIAYSGEMQYIYYWNASVGKSGLDWPGDMMTERKRGDDGQLYWCYKVPAGTTHVVFNNGKTGNEEWAKEQTGDLIYNDQYVMCEAGATSVSVKFTTPGEEDNEPETIAAVWPSNTRYCYFYKPDDWSVPCVWAWISASNSTNCGLASDWPGDPMTSTSGKYFWKASNNSVGMIDISNNGGTKAGNKDLSFINGATYYLDGGHIGGEDYVSKNPDRLYLLGTIKDHNWAPNYDGIVLEKIDYKGIYVAYNVPLTDSPNATFSFTTATGSSWDDLNSKAVRFGTPTKDFHIEANKPSHITRFEGGNTGGAESWEIAAGTYDVIVDLYDMTVTLLPSQAAPAVEALQLAEVQANAGSPYSGYAYITYPATGDKAYGVKVNGDNITATRISVNGNNDYHDRGKLILTNKVLVTTTLSDLNGYGFEAMTASIGTKQADGSFRAIRTIDNLLETTYESQVNYYYTLHQGVDVKVPLQSPVGTANITLEPVFYLVSSAPGGAYGNPSMLFSPATDSEGTKIYTLEYARIASSEQLYVQTWGNAYRPSRTEKDMKPGYTNGLDFDPTDGAGYASLDENYLNVVFTLIPQEEADMVYFWYDGTPDNSFTVTVGNDKTNQSGNVTQAAGSQEGRIELYTMLDAAVIFVYSPSPVHYYTTDVTNARNVRAAQGDPTYTKAAYDTRFSNGAYMISLPTDTQGKLVLATKDDDASEYTPQGTYNYIVTRSAPLGIDDIAEDYDEAEYYTLQGVRVANPVSGVYIRVCGGRADKVIVR